MGSELPIRPRTFHTFSADGVPYDDYITGTFAYDEAGTVGNYAPLTDFFMYWRDGFLASRMWGSTWVNKAKFDVFFGIQAEFQDGVFVGLTGEARRSYPTIIDLTVSFTTGRINYPTNGGFGQWVTMTNLAYTTTPDAQEIPEPSTILLLTTGLAGLATRLRRRAV